MAKISDWKNWVNHKKLEDIVMLVGDIVYNNNFDCNCNYAVYDCSGKDTFHDDGGKLVFSTLRDGYGKPLDTTLDLQVKYITTSDNVLIIEGAKNK